MRASQPDSASGPVCCSANIEVASRQSPSTTDRYGTTNADAWPRRDEEGWGSRIEDRRRHEATKPSFAVQALALVRTGIFMPDTGAPRDLYFFLPLPPLRAA